MFRKSDGPYYSSLTYLNNYLFNCLNFNIRFVSEVSFLLSHHYFVEAVTFRCVHDWEPPGGRSIHFQDDAAGPDLTDNPVRFTLAILGTEINN